jgi:nicotinamide mononucleotide transporter
MGNNMTGIEAIAVVFGLACVVLTIKQNIWCWPTGLVQVSLFILIFYDARLYSDLILHVIYVVLQVYGWYHWLHGGEARSALQVTRMPVFALAAWILACVLGTALWGYGMDTYTDAAVPYPDAFTTVASLIAQWLMARKKLASWFFWIAVDVVAIGVYLYKQLYLTTGLYAVFLVLAVIGFLAWRKTVNPPETEAEAGVQGA